jgi:hypothetical protein
MNSTAVFYNNLRFLKEKYEGVFRQITGKTPLNHIRLKAARQGGDLLERQISNGRWLPLHSRYNPRREAEIWAADQDLAGKRHVLLFGLGLGYHLEALLQRYPNTDFYIYEPDLHLFLNTLSERDWTAFPWRQVSKIAFDEKGVFCQDFIREIFRLVKDDWTFLSLPAFERCFADEFGIVRNTIREEKDEYLRYLDVNTAYQREWTLNAARNIPYLIRCNSIFDYQDVFQNKTLVMVASGPSLNEAIPYLQAIKERRKAMIMAIGTSINVLLKNNIEPDLFISYDPSKENYIVLQTCLDRGVPLLFGSTIQHEIIRNHTGPKAYFLLSQDTILPYLLGNVPDEQVIFDAPSIAVPALQLLNALKVVRVILAGQDLAYYQDYNYAEGASVLWADGKVSLEEKAAYVEVKANNGEKVFTSPIYNAIRASLEKIISQGQFSAVLNPARYGAEIAGAEHVGWDEVLALLQDGAYEQGICFAEHESGRPVRTIKKNVLATLTTIENSLKQVHKHMNLFLNTAPDAAEEKLNKIYNQLDRALLQLTSGQEYRVFIYPMIRNEDHLLKKYFPDIPKMTFADKKKFVDNQVRMYVEGVTLSLLKLKDAVSAWK